MNKQTNRSIAHNRKARYDYNIEQTLEAGLSLLGWEVKGLRKGSLQLKEGFVSYKEGELFLQGAHIQAPTTTSTHIEANPKRVRKLLLKSTEIAQIRQKIERKGYTVVPLSAYWRRGKAKLEIAIAKGKKQHDKRQAIQERDWERSKHREIKQQR